MIMKIEINKEEIKEEVDWSKKQLVYCTRSNIVYYVINDIDEDTFEGVVVGGDSLEFCGIVIHNGYFVKEEISKDNMIVFKGDIILSNY